MKHTGSCHCGNVKFEVEMDTAQGMTCNCSICTKRGSVLGFAPEANFKLLAGENEMKEYLFNKHVIHHLFCKNCGILPFAKAPSPDGVKMVAVNLRCLDGIDLSKVQIQEYDGRSR